MVIFTFHKLVRDKLREEYVRFGQKANYRKLSKKEHVEKLKQKIIEEASEIPLDGSQENITNEIADVYQALEDLATLNDISTQQIIEVKQKKFDKKGGFAGGTYVETIELQDDDTWVAYYRNESEKYQELPQK